MKHFLLGLALICFGSIANAAHTSPIGGERGTGGPNVASSVTASSVTVSNLPANSVVYTRGGGILAAVSTFSFTPGGNVGIGTASPGTTLHVIGNSAITDGITTSSMTVDAAGGGVLKVSRTGFATSLKAEVDGTNGYLSTSGGAGALSFRVNDVEKMQVSAAGHVLVGTMTIKGNGSGLPQGIALCVTSAQVLGYCTTAALPACTCVAP